MSSINKVILIGNLGNNPEIRSFENGGMIATLSIATSERWTDKQTGERKEQTEWHRVVLNDKLAEIALYAHRYCGLSNAHWSRWKHWQSYHHFQNYALLGHYLSYPQELPYLHSYFVPFF